MMKEQLHFLGIMLNLHRHNPVFDIFQRDNNSCIDVEVSGFYCSSYLLGKCQVQHSWLEKEALSSLIFSYKSWTQPLLLSSVRIVDVLLENILTDWLVFLAGILLKIHYPFGGGIQVEQGQEDGLSESDTQGFCLWLKHAVLFVARHVI